MKKIRIKNRIVNALAAAPNQRMKYANLMFAVFPVKEYPNAYRNGSNGGPPGCCMVFGRALRELKAACIITDSYVGRGYTSEYTFHLVSKRDPYAKEQS